MKVVIHTVADAEDLIDQLVGVLAHKDLFQLVVKLDQAVDNPSFTEMLENYFDLRCTERHEREARKSAPTIAAQYCAGSCSRGGDGPSCGKIGCVG